MTRTVKQKEPLLPLRFRGLFSKSPRNKLIGEILVQKEVITRTSLDNALHTQKQRFFQKGVAVPLGTILVERGHATSAAIDRALEEYDNLASPRLLDRVKSLAGAFRGRLSDDIPAPRIPIWLQLSIATVFVLAVSSSVLSYVIMERQRGKLYEHMIKLGKVSLNYVADNAKVPLLNEDTLALNTLINNVASVDGHYYAFIVDNNNIIKAHTDHEKIDRELTPFSNIDQVYQEGQLTYFNHSLPDGSNVLNISMPILFQDKKLGEVNVGLSVDFIRDLFINERTFLAFATLIIIILGMVAAIIFGLRFSRPVSTLVEATSEFARGNYDFKVNLKRNDEFGTLGDAFNRMGTELFRQSMMRETFGKYVGPEVLDMIMRSSGQTWLKGQKNEASILFADIRGFTRYAEVKEPEKVVEKLNEFFSIATEVVLEHDGYIDKFIGDSVLAIFGVPVYQKDHIERCIRAAVAMQKELARAAQLGNTLLASVGIGIASGPVVAGNIGSQVKMEYTVIGDSVNVASYINSLAGPGEIIVGSDKTIQPTGFAKIRQLEPHKVKGREELVNVFQVLGYNEY
jgi:adenylate cyclase